MSEKKRRAERESAHREKKYQKLLVTLMSTVSIQTNKFVFELFAIKCDNWKTFKLHYISKN